MSVFYIIRLFNFFVPNCNLLSAGTVIEPYDLLNCLFRRVPSDLISTIAGALEATNISIKYRYDAPKNDIEEKEADYPTNRCIHNLIIHSRRTMTRIGDQLAVELIYFIMNHG